MERAWLDTPAYGGKYSWKGSNCRKGTMSNGIRKCADCAFDVDLESVVDCAEHRWHTDPDAPWGIYIGAIDDWDMCCKCGKDAYAVMK